MDKNWKYIIDAANNIFPPWEEIEVNLAQDLLVKIVLIEKNVNAKEQLAELKRICKRSIGWNKIKKIKRIYE